nr:BTB/POZ domain-containing protein NPY2-like isoform X1 [Ipomoea batatas]
MKFMKLGSKPDCFQSEGNNLRLQQTTLPAHAVGDHVANLTHINSGFGAQQQPGGNLQSTSQVNVTFGNQNDLNNLIVNVSTIPTANIASTTVHGLNSIYNANIGSALPNVDNANYSINPTPSNATVRTGTNNVCSPIVHGLNTINNANVSNAMPTVAIASVVHGSNLLNNANIGNVLPTVNNANHANNLPSAAICGTQFPLLSKSAHLQKLVTNSKEGNGDEVHIRDIPRRHTECLQSDCNIE